MGRSASVGGWVHRWVAGLGAPINTFCFFVFRFSFFCFLFLFFFFPIVVCGLWCGGGCGCGCVGRSASVGGWVHWWVVGLWAMISTFCLFVFFFPPLLWSMGCGVVVVVVVWVDWCVHGGGSSGFHGAGCGCCLLGLVGVGLVDCFFLCCGLWWWW